ncbi:MAG: hypothetical protein BECKG1743D_GA0114223_102713 [Candidatus Kentron sp. G]|nr:MAG: hypothetical protein BECKG1743F_GA0114225_102473 [Candidatus Kentron sp. G]VFM99211.1 MAG: hypothetical protein BECKG1743E_GA0114224_102412 [Candidatus Kentron sp. G]VFN01338.1 MAG: hypothetical protein BECKG1743D_GA0114223_102713 [Candidatus Kentron sp. G]
MTGHTPHEPQSSRNSSQDAPRPPATSSTRPAWGLLGVSALVVTLGVVLPEPWWLKVSFFALSAAFGLFAAGRLMGFVPERWDKPAESASIAVITLSVAALMAWRLWGSERVTVLVVALVALAMPVPPLLRWRKRRLAPPPAEPPHGNSEEP